MWWTQRLALLQDLHLSLCFPNLLCQWHNDTRSHVSLALSWSHETLPLLFSCIPAAGQRWYYSQHLSLIQKLWWTKGPIHLRKHDRGKLSIFKLLLRTTYFFSSYLLDCEVRGMFANIGAQLCNFCMHYWPFKYNSEYNCSIIQHLHYVLCDKYIRYIFDSSEIICHNYQMPSNLHKMRLGLCYTLGTPRFRIFMASAFFWDISEPISLIQALKPS